MKHFTFAICGFALTVTALMFSLLPEYMPTVVLKDVQGKDGSAEISDIFQVVTAGPLEFYSIKVQADYKIRIRKNETALVRAKVTQRYMETNFDEGATDTPRRRKLNNLAWNISLELHGPEFKIEPEIYPLALGAPLPANATWAVSPRTTGNHYLLLNSEGINPQGNEWHKHADRREVVLNGRRVVEPDSQFQLELPIEVLTKWGVSQLWRDLIAGAIGLVGFVFGMFQVRVMILRRD